MLSRVANNLYWMARYVERAENTARILDVTYRMSLMPKEPSSQDQEWFAPLNITGTLFPFTGRYSTVSAREVLHFMVLDPENPSSIYSCARQARENARAVRGAITSEMWEVLNTTWLEMQQMDEARLTRARRLDLLRLGEGALPPVPRRDLRHHAPRRGLPLQPPGHFLERAGQHRAHPRREVPRAAAQREGRRRRGGLLPVGGGAALGVGVRGLPQGLPRRDHAAASGRAADPARRHAARAALLHAARSTTSSSCVQQRRTRRRALRLRRRRSMSRPAVRARSTRSSRTGCTSTSPTSSTRLQELCRRQSQTSFFCRLADWAPRSGRAL